LLAKVSSSSGCYHKEQAPTGQQDVLVSTTSGPKGFPAAFAHAARYDAGWLAPKAVAAIFILAVVIGCCRAVTTLYQVHIRAAKREPEPWNVNPKIFPP